MYCPMVTMSHPTEARSASTPCTSSSVSQARPSGRSADAPGFLTRRRSSSYLLIVGLRPDAGCNARAGFHIMVDDVGSASMTVCRPRGLPRKSGMSTSMVGQVSPPSRMACREGAKWADPPSVRSSRHGRHHGMAQAEGRRLAHAGLRDRGRGWRRRRCCKAQLRVQVLPRMRNVAVLREKHSNMFGHLALWQTVCRSSPSRGRGIGKGVAAGQRLPGATGIRKGFEFSGADIFDLLHGKESSPHSRDRDVASASWRPHR